MLSAAFLMLFGIVGAFAGGAIGLAIGSSVAAFIQNTVLWYVLKKRVGVSTHIGRLSLPVRQPAGASIRAGE